MKLQDPADKITQTFVLGCDPTVTVEITQTPEGTLFFKLSPAVYDGAEPDLDGLFLNLTDDTRLDALNFFSDVNDLPITGQQADVNMVTSLSNGATPSGNFDVALQFGLTPDSTGGTVSNLGFTLWSDDGPLTLDDIDTASMAVLVDSDGPDGLVLTVADGPDAVHSVVAIDENFDDITDPAQSDAIVSDDNWEIRDNQLYTDGNNDGELRFAPVSTDGPTLISFDARAGGLQNFEGSGSNADSITVQVRVDGGDWGTLDSFVVNADNSAMVGSETGQSFDSETSQLRYDGGPLDAAGTVEFRMVSDISAADEKIFIDNVEIATSTVVDGGMDHDDGDCEGFEDLEAGDTVSDQYDGVTITAQKAGDDDDSQNDAMIFDTANPTGGDHDLASDTAGNVIIISEDNDSDDPDDNAQGGTMSFSFESPSQVQSLNFLDIEEVGGTIDLYDLDGELITTLDIPVTGDGEEQVLDINVDNVSVMDINLVGSGAVDDLCYVSPAVDDCTAQYGVEYLDDIPMVAVDEDQPIDDEDPIDMMPL